jgi:hypothetical protein
MSEFELIDPKTEIRGFNVFPKSLFIGGLGDFGAGSLLGECKLNFLSRSGSNFMPEGCLRIERLAGSTPGLRLLIGLKLVLI